MYTLKIKNMKKLTVLLMLCVVVSGVLSLYSCSNAKAVDVVEGVIPVHTDAWRSQLVRSLQLAGTDQERTEILNNATNRLTNQLIGFLRTSGYNCRIDTILYRYGSGKADAVAGGDKKNHTGVFKDQPYAVIKGDTCFQDSMYVFIRCFNGTFSLSAPGATTIGTGPTEFTIDRLQGINRYVDYKTSIWLANRFDLVLYEGQGWAGKRISSERALQLEDSLAYKAVTVRVYPGDHFDLGTMTYTPAKRY